MLAVAWSLYASEARAGADTLHRSAVDAPAGRDSRSVGAFVRRQP